MDFSGLASGNVQLIPRNIPSVFPESEPATPEETLKDNQQIKLLSYGGPKCAWVQGVSGNVPPVPGGVRLFPVNMSHIIGSTLHLPQNFPAAVAFIEDSMPPPMQIYQQTVATKL